MLATISPLVTRNCLSVGFRFWSIMQVYSRLLILIYVSFISVLPLLNLFDQAFQSFEEVRSTNIIDFVWEVLSVEIFFFNVNRFEFHLIKLLTSVFIVLADNHYAKWSTCICNSNLFGFNAFSLHIQYSHIRTHQINWCDELILIVSLALSLSFLFLRRSF